MISVMVSAAAAAPTLDALQEELWLLGYIEGQNIALETHFTGGQFERISQLVTDLSTAVATDPLLFAHHVRILEAVQTHGLPSMFGFRQFAEAGGWCLMEPAYSGCGAELPTSWITS